jgi:hypothetical protein
MVSSATPDPNARPTRPHPDPLVMTPAEKAMAEWEARHDVIARGGRLVPGSVQHYLSESRSRERCDEAARPRPEHRRAVAPGTPPVPPTTEELAFRLAPPEHRPRRIRRIG